MNGNKKFIELATRSMQMSDIAESISNESIARQDGKFFERLTEAISQMRNTDYSTEAIKKSFIVQVIKQYTGISTVIEVGDDLHVFIINGPVTVNHVFDLGRQQYETVDVLKRTLIKGTVNAQTGMVTGVFSELTNIIHLGAKVLKNNKYKDEHIAAILLHEIGHKFTYYQFITNASVVSYIISNTAKQLLNSDSYAEREIIIKRADELMGVDTRTLNPADLISNPKPGVEILLLSRFSLTPNILTSNLFYDIRNVEQLADTYAVRQGAGAYLSEALQYYWRDVNKTRRHSALVEILCEVGTLISSMQFGTAFLAYLFSAPTADIYDDPKDRIEFIRQQLIDDLKNVSKNDKLMRDKIVKEIEVVENVKKEIYERFEIVKLFQRIVSSKGRALMHGVKLQKQLEAMLYNDLFYKSAKIKQLLN